MSLRTTTIQIDGTAYTIREVPASFLRRHEGVDSGAAQVDLLGLCVLVDGEPLGARADEEIPLRVIPDLARAIMDLSGLSEGKGEAVA